MVYDDQAQPLSTHFGEYLLPLATDVPRVDLHAHGDAVAAQSARRQGRGRGRHHPGDRGASSSAVENALAPFGVRIAEAPITPQRIVELLGEAALGRTR